MDFTKAVKTIGGYKVAGLFVDRKYIRGYVRGRDKIWRSMTWFVKDGKDIVGVDEIPPSPLNLKL